MRRAPRAPSRAAPVLSGGPETTTACPRVYLCPSTRISGNCPPHRDWRLAKVAGFTSASTASGMPISASCTSPHSARPGRSRWPGLRRKNVTVVVACTTGPAALPVVPSRPLGTSTATTGLADALMAATTSAATPSSGRESPAPNSASMMTSAPAIVPASSGSASPHRAAISAASPLSASRAPSRPSRTAKPRSRNSRAATNPSPPLLPGPQTTAIEGPAPAASAMAASATARPAFSIRTSPGTPCPIAR